MGGTPCDILSIQPYKCNVLSVSTLPPDRPRHSAGAHACTYPTRRHCVRATRRFPGWRLACRRDAQAPREKSCVHSARGRARVGAGVARRMHGDWAPWARRSGSGCGARVAAGVAVRVRVWLLLELLAGRRQQHPPTRTHWRRAWAEDEGKHLLAEGVGMVTRASIGRIDRMLDSTPSSSSELPSEDWSAAYLHTQGKLTRHHRVTTALSLRHHASSPELAFEYLAVTILSHTRPRRKARQCPTCV